MYSQMCCHIYFELHVTGSSAAAAHRGEKLLEGASISIGPGCLSRGLPRSWRRLHHSVECLYHFSAAQSKTMIGRMDVQLFLVALACFAARLSYAAELEGVSPSVLSKNGPFYTSNFGLPVYNNNESLTVGARGTLCSSLSLCWWMRNAHYVGYSRRSVLHRIQRNANIEYGLR